MQPTEVDFSRLSIGAAASTALTLMEEEIKDLNHQIDKAAFAAIEQGRLTGEQAQMYFARKHALYAVYQRLVQKTKTGQNAGKRLAQQGV